mgnify:CR=1 FL=1
METKRITIKNYIKIAVEELSRQKIYELFNKQ